MRIGSRAGTDGAIVTIDGAATSVTKNANMTTGLTINQGAADDEILALKSSDVTGAWTSITEADTFGYFAKNSGNEGGLLIRGLTESNNHSALKLIGTVDFAAVINTKSTAGRGAVNIIGDLENGAGGVGDIAAAGNILSVRNNGTTALIVGVGGDTWQAGGATMSGDTDSAAVADQVTFGGYEIGAGNRVIALSQETAVASDTDETKFSHKMQVRINGATYFIMLTAS